MVRSVQKSLVSVVISAYNYADFIAQAIDSVLAQTYPNCEIIVINDGSTDETAAILKSYSGIITVNRDRKGLVFTRNQGVEIAKGKYVLQLDADDYLHETYIEKTVAVAEKYNVDIVYTQVHVFGRTKFQSKYIQFDLEKLKHDNFIHATALIRKSALGDNPYDPYLDEIGNEDWDLVLDLCLNGATARLLDEPLLYYRKHKDKKSRSDKFESSYKEMLARHHVWSKQNEKHPNEFWYFSSQIELLFSMIRMYDQHEALRSKIKELKNENAQKSTHIEEMERRDLVMIAKKITNKLKRKK